MSQGLINSPIWVGGVAGMAAVMIAVAAILVFGGRAWEGWGDRLGTRRRYQSGASDYHGAYTVRPLSVLPLTQLPNKQGADEHGIQHQAASGQSEE